MAAQQLIPVFQGTISNQPALLCDARELHSFLKVLRDFSTWIKERIAEYGFVKDQDFMIIPQNRGKIGRGRPTTDYHLTMDMAKELSMVERNEQGKQARQYFIECEKRVHNLPATPDRTQAALMTATEVAAHIQRDVFNAIMVEKNFWSGSRWFVALNYDANNKKPSAFIKHLELDEFITSFDSLAERMSEPNSLNATNIQLANLAMACTLALTRRMERTARTALK